VPLPETFIAPRYILAPYVATADDVVERMLDLARVGPDDVVFDLGCGDGRLAIAAARRGARAYGVDIEPWWVEQSRLNAEAAGVADRARFEQRDAMDVDVSTASVVVLYLVHWSTQRMAAELLERCAPGTRIVSNSFPFEGRARARTQSIIDATGQSRDLHLWVLPELGAAACAGGMEQRPSNKE
jgi:2-polyprenyl-3-methyl-5-hydroxy-6-metoxy-1,4-benzoquinol methylase